MSISKGDTVRVEHNNGAYIATVLNTDNEKYIVQVNDIIRQPETNITEWDEKELAPKYLTPK